MSSGSPSISQSGGSGVGSALPNGANCRGQTPWPLRIPLRRAQPRFIPHTPIMNLPTSRVGRRFFWNFSRPGSFRDRPGRITEGAAQLKISKSKTKEDDPNAESYPKDHHRRATKRRVPANCGGNARARQQEAHAQSQGLKEGKIAARRSGYSQS